MNSWRENDDTRLIKGSIIGTPGDQEDQKLPWKEWCLPCGAFPFMWRSYYAMNREMNIYREK